MKILIVTHEDPGQICGGLGTFIREYVTHLKEKTEVRLLYFDFTGVQPSTSPLVDHQFPMECGESGQTHESRIQETALNARAKCQSLLEDFQPDLIHCHDRQTFLPFQDLSNVVFSLHLSIPDLLGPKNWDSNWFEEFKIERLALNKSRSSAVYSRFMALRVQALFDPRRLPEVLPLGHDWSNYQGHKPIRGPEEPLRVSYFGRFEDHQKGYLEFIEAAGLLNQEPWNRSLEWRIYGRGELPYLPPNLIHGGFVEGAAKIRAYRESDVVVMPSRFEPFGLVGLEALASNCLLLTTEGLGMDEFMKPNHQDCFVVPKGSSIAEKITHVFQNWSYWKEKRMEGRATALQFPWERSINAHMDWYRSCL